MIPRRPLTPAEIRELVYEGGESVSTVYQRARYRDPAITKDEIRRIVFSRAPL